MPSFIIESMCDFMSDHNSDSSVIDGIRKVGVIQRWLQYSRRYRCKLIKLY